MSSTNHVVNAPSDTCPTTSGNYSTTGAHPYCKPTDAAHQPFGVGTRSQLTYYSNYGKRNRRRRPGGARKFNLPAVDRGGTEGDFSITSNFGQEIPCVIFDGSSADPDPDGYYGVPTQTGFDDDQCYTAMQGVDGRAPRRGRAGPDRRGAHPELAGQPAKLVKFLKSQAVTPIKSLANATPPLSPTDVSNTDLSGAACPGGYCHLGGKAIMAKEAFGAGLVNAAKAVAGGAAGP